MSYNLKYKKSGAIFWKILKGVKGDGFIDESSNGRSSNSARFFILLDESRVEIPSEDHIFKFSKERHFLILDQVKKDTGQVN